MNIKEPGKVGTLSLCLHYLPLAGLIYQVHAQRMVHFPTD